MLKPFSPQHVCGENTATQAPWARSPVRTLAEGVPQGGEIAETRLHFDFSIANTFPSFVASFPLERRFFWYSDACIAASLATFFISLEKEKYVKNPPTNQNLHHIKKPLIQAVSFIIS